MKTINYLAGLIVLLFFVASCKEDPKEGSSFVNLRMTDAPANYTAVNIDLKEVELIGEGDVSIMMDAKPGIYNLLDLTNGIDVLIASSTVHGGRIEQIRLILGDRNTIVVDGVSHDLKTPSAEQSGLKIQVHKDLEPGVVYDLLIDFDANQSIVEQGNGGYLLKPVIHVVDLVSSGSISGKVIPAGSIVQVKVTGNDLTFTTNTTITGEFIVPGIPEGVYTVIFYPPSPSVTVTLTNIAVEEGAITDLGIVDLSGQ